MNDSLALDFTLNFKELYETVEYLIKPFKIIKVDKNKAILRLYYTQSKWYFIIFIGTTLVSKEIKSIVTNITPEGEMVIPLDIQQLEQVLKFYSQLESQKHASIPTVTLKFDFKVTETQKFLRSTLMVVNQQGYVEEGINLTPKRSQLHKLSVVQENSTDIINKFKSFDFTDKVYTTYATDTIKDDFSILLPSLKNAKERSPESNIVFKEGKCYAISRKLGVFMYSPKCEFFQDLLISNQIGSLLYSFVNGIDTFEFCKVEQENKGGVSNIINRNVTFYTLYFKINNYQIVFDRCCNTNGVISYAPYFPNGIEGIEALPKNQFVLKSFALEQALKSLTLVRTAGLTSENLNLIIKFNFGKEMSSFIVKNENNENEQPCAYYSSEGDTEDTQISFQVPVDVFERAMLDKSEEYIFCFETMPNKEGVYRMAITTPEYIEKLKGMQKEESKEKAKKTYQTDWVSVAINLPQVRMENEVGVR